MEPHGLYEAYLFYSVNLVAVCWTDFPSRQLVGSIRSKLDGVPSLTVKLVGQDATRTATHNLINNVDALKNVILTLEPVVVEKAQNCTLRCTYDLEGAPLYAVKWYRGIKEFYRYTPNDTPTTKVFKTTGINVDEEQSNGTQVILYNVDFNLSGKFSCEVTTDEGFSTAQDIKVMKVVQLPEDSPTISVSTEPLDYGDRLNASCMSPKSKPPATLKFLLNNRTVARTDPLLIMKMSQEHSWSDLLLNITLDEEHFNAGRLVLRCEAHIDNIYHKYAELKLSTARDPVPERVSAYDSAIYAGPSITAIHFIIINYAAFLIK